MAVREEPGSRQLALESLRVLGTERLEGPDERFWVLGQLQRRVYRLRHFVEALLGGLVSHRFSFASRIWWVPGRSSVTAVDAPSRSRHARVTAATDERLMGDRTIACPISGPRRLPVTTARE